MKNNYLIYKKITESFVNKDTKRFVKVAFSNALSSVERFFNKYFNSDLNLIVKDDNLDCFLKIYPSFSIFNIDEINELINIVRMLRNECSHFFASKNISFVSNKTIIEKIKQISSFKFLVFETHFYQRVILKIEAV